MSVGVLHKNDELTPVSKHLQHREIRCKCSYPNCTYTLIAFAAVESFEALREAHGGPLKVNSFFRCQQHNKDVSGKPSSKHTIGYAIDIECPDGVQIEVFAEMARQAGFDVVIIYAADNFIHCQIKL